MKWKPGPAFRRAIAFLSDLGGAVVAVAAGAGLLAGGGVLATNLLPIGVLLVLAMGAALIAFGGVVQFLGPKWRASLPPAPAPPAPTPLPPDPGRASADAARRAARLIGEELRDNRAFLWRMSQGYERTRHFSGDSWIAESPALLDYSDPRPYRVAREAYRLIDRVDGWRRNNQIPSIVTEPALAADITVAVEAIDEAGKVLDQVETPPSG
jgi:hypothetical protein